MGKAEEYEEFLQKFLQKRTTDDCYTPRIIYAAAAWVEREYNVSFCDFARTLYPCGDYGSRCGGFHRGK